MSESPVPDQPRPPFLLATPDELHLLKGDQLTRQTTYLQGLLLSVQHGLWEWHPKTGALRAQGEIWLLFAETEGQALNKLWTGEELPLVYTEERDRVRAMCQRAAGDEGCFDIIFRAYENAGQLRWLRFLGRTVTVDDGAERIVFGCCTDVSAIVSRRTPYSLPGAQPLQVFSGVGDGLWEWDLNADEMVLDDACWAILGYETSPIRRIDRSAAAQWKARILSEDFSRVEQAMSEHVRGQFPLDVEFRLWRSDGSIVWVRCRGKVQLNNCGQPTRVLGTLQDVSGSRETLCRVERELQQQRAENVRRSDLLFSLSHELRTPLNAILGYSRMVELDASLNSDQRQRLGEIRRAGQHLLHLVGDVLELARIDSRRLGPSMESIRPAELVADCKRLLEPLAETRRVSLIFEPLGWESAYICADPVRYKQVVLNLVGNAVKYNRDNGRVIISFAPQAEGWLRLNILDTGKGISPERRDEVFEPFNRLGEEKGHIEGTGVGLAIAKRLTEAMGGRIDFDSQEGQGSVFWIEFPMIDAPDTLMSLPAQPEIPLQLPAGRLLMVDNRPEAASRLKEMLKETPQIQCLIATDGVEAIFMARTLNPDVLLFHNAVPGMSASDLARILEEDSSTRATRFVLVGGDLPGGSHPVLPEQFDFVQLSKVLANRLMRPGQPVV
ncbi:ATP-binding protein [Microbulbifer sp. 2205BS26-8]|uniref:ATP-binding response regulator n=1 Tax=Microbulbifer sp. 2205BS26-8 TaxID=3064386 RepID=UPI00273FAE49|nr:ATP-binding protein [Microbulbifer sp. 2205BS26-8]MDP5210085.1 ATP-binding protein [Microbulbifer sp. 2205BS26-8]